MFSHNKETRIAYLENRVISLNDALHSQRLVLDRLNDHLLQFMEVLGYEWKKQTLHIGKIESGNKFKK